MFDFKLVLPKAMNNHYQGHKVALWFFYIITAVTLWRSQHHLFAQDGGAQSIATIPLHTFSSEATAAIVGTFALWGLSQLIIGFLYLITSLFYKSLIPMMYILGIFEYSVRAFYISNFKPIPTMGDAPGAIINLPLVVIFTTMLLLSIHKK
ncbi:hypothetical protein [Paraferrimonas sp. SM1919]|uniref:hypothetical protein n=1 Tax=Paraferrimonas sp. SM1919 TaxID=2662263 RepID=UPI001969C2D4|nr:hypothetical protein [Paraferrimonas sp. SM1919]